MQTILLLSEESSEDQDYPFGRLLTSAGLTVLPFPLSIGNVREKGQVDAIALAVTASRTASVLRRLRQRVKLPIIWCCDDSDPKSLTTEEMPKPDGILYRDMNPAQIQWVLSTSMIHHRRQIRCREKINRLY
ncbi:hypothetical protein GCM10011571_16220 [Marinithermofilum abyssi]|uniref:Uncharacterized protein n=1 Tax=Marinithermofilum abyssi TaxID=1571185 RepID=A0A8J2YDY6_9BACL|nr:hypothetical protein [Marinithermofilum abyssi]GGE15399.1 hypothetical protein GCM10011571_16220 [Marinithermofilum abyssi]